MWGRHSCLPSHARADRNVRATLGHHSQMAIDHVATCRYPSIPVVSSGSAGGLEDEDEDEDEDERPQPPISSPVAFDKVWRQGVETRCGDKVCHWAQRSAFTL